MKKYTLLAIVAAVFITACSKDEVPGEINDKSGIFKGPEVAVCDGKAWTWVELNSNGDPERVAVVISEDALNSLEVADTNPPSGHEDPLSFVLEFDSNANATIFRHVWLNWNPAGHEPQDIYTVPHFDIHYYMVTAGERESFLDPDKLDESLDPAYLPPNYIGVDPVPAMGKHYVDITSPELNGHPFTETFIYGSYEARMVFLEPMITLQFLMETQEFERAIPQAAQYQESGYFPTKMRVRKHNGETEIILEDMVYRSAS